LTNNEKNGHYEAYRIVVAKRGSSNRTEAFGRGLQLAKAKLRQKQGIENTASIEVVASNPDHLPAGGGLFPLGNPTLF